MIGSEGFTIHWAPIKEQLMPRYAICLFLTSCRIILSTFTKKIIDIFILFHSISPRSCWYSSGWHQSFFQHFHCLDGANTYQRYDCYKHKLMHISLYETTGTSNGKMDFSLFTEGISDGMRFWHVLTVLEWPVVQYDVVCLLFYYAHLRHLLFLHWDHLPYPY